MSVPKSLQPAFDDIEPLITDFCNQYLNGGKGSWFMKIRKFY